DQHSAAPRRELLTPAITRGADEFGPPTPTSGQPAQLPIPTSSSNSEASEPSAPIIALNGADAAAAAIAARFAQTAWTIQPGDSANSWIARVADITLADYQARLEEGARRATAAQLAPANVRVAAVSPITPETTKWRFQVTLVITVTERTGSRMTSDATVVDVADTPAGPKVATAR
nr:hypothetical protein [Actinomycetota bacterium]